MKFAKIQRVLVLVSLGLSPSLSYEIIGSEPLAKGYGPADTLCLAANIYHEARGETLEGQVAVAQVTINRTRYPDKFKSTLCGVVYHYKQFSWTITKPELIKDKKAWETSKQVALSVLKNYDNYPYNPATYYHTKKVKPHWAKNKQVVAIIGNHIFYK